MGQCAYFREISSSLLARLVAEPRLVLGVLALRPRDFSALLESVPAEARAQVEEALNLVVRESEAYGSIS